MSRAFYPKSVRNNCNIYHSGSIVENRLEVTTLGVGRELGATVFFQTKDDSGCQDGDE